MLSEYGYEYDSNSALAELDKGLRSNNIGEKVEVIVKVPTYFEKFPSSVFVNAVFLKLTEVFCSSTNLLRKCILQVAERSESHLIKIISVDPIAKRIMSVSYSNDPIVKALTLRLFGWLSQVFSDNQQIHHLIRTSLDSKDAEELDAAIFAAERFAEHSEEFSNAIYDKVAEMLINDDVALEIKIAIVPVFQHMHTDPVTTDRVFSLCKTQLLANCPSTTLACSILRTLTGLALSSLTVLSVQVVTRITAGAVMKAFISLRREFKTEVLRDIDLLLDALNNSPKFSVKRTAAYCMVKIAKLAPHFWNKQIFITLCNYIGNVENTQKYNVLRLDVMKVLLCLTKNKIIVAWEDLSEVAVKLLSMCSVWISLKLHNLLAANCEVLANLLKHCGTELDSVALEFYGKLVNIIPLWDWSDSNTVSGLYFKKMLLSIVVFCQRYTSFALPIARSVCYLIDRFSVDKESLIFETLFALADCEPSIVNVFQSIANKLNIYKWHFLLVSSNDDSTTDMLLDKSSTQLTGWQLYKLARFSSRYGKHVSAYRIFQRVEEMIVSDLFYHWIKALTTLSLAECQLMNNEKLSEVLSLYTKTLFYLKAAVSNNHNLWFPIEYVTLKMEFLKLIGDMRVVWNISRITPPPSNILISSNGASNVIMTQLIEKFSNCVKSSDSLAEKYDKLMFKCSDADLNSINSLRLERVKLHLIQQCLLLVLDKEIRPLSLPDKDALNACCLVTVGRLENVISQIALLRKSADKLSVEVINKSLIIVDDLVRQPTYLFSYFFRSAQTASSVKIGKPG